MPVLSVHAPCLLISQRVWGANPISKLDRSVRAAEELGAQTVVVHPPFRWQRRYAEGFTDQVAELEASSDVMVAVENMFPFRADRFFGTGQPSIERMRKRGGTPGRSRSRRSRRHTTRWTATTPTTRWTCRTRRPRAPMPWRWRERMGDGLVHLHLCDGSGASTDEHLVPGRGTQPAAEICQMLAASNFAGHVILEVTTSRRAGLPPNVSSC